MSEKSSTNRNTYQRRKAAVRAEALEDAAEIAERWIKESTRDDLSGTYVAKQIALELRARANEATDGK